ncbi:hypothetical protein CIN_18800 [Commensalibacter intestini A911]|uniref:Uncharacterized protein n=1 Tax=Commensalibacter intestini A911 TaxID=1088868 RepID=G6F2N4_9PROT|nr:hypothetical protein [Commensalibacter intestini]EHD13143.1 hypothetical protein CIN_18800 [Commensalibacter intestini A911]
MDTQRLKLQTLLEYVKEDTAHIKVSATMLYNELKGKKTYRFVVLLI